MTDLTSSQKAQILGMPVELSNNGEISNKTKGRICQILNVPFDKVKITFNPKTQHLGIYL